jgi:Delta3-Delta2-enoyl-CoA isomerase
MAAPTPLFTIPIEPWGEYPGGSIVATEPEANVYLLTFASPPDNRLIAPFCNAMLKALDAVEFGYPPGVVITTSGIQKFYSNGLDLAHAQEVEGYWADALYAMWRRFLT